MTSIRPRKAYHALVLVLGCALFIYLLVRLGPAEILTLLLRIGWYFGLMVAAYAGHQTVRAAALGRCIIPNQRAAYADLVRIRLSGEAGQPFSTADPFVIESASKFVGLAFFFIPGQMGAAEGTYAVIFQAIGLPALAGLSLALARRLRTLLVAGIGLVLLMPARRGNG